MPNIDSGHYYLTALIPLLLTAEVGDDGAVATPTNRLRRLLALMPTTGGDDAPSLYGEEQAADDRTSAFARNRLNHFVRFAVIEDVNYNGRMTGDGIGEALRKVDPATPQSADHLSRPYLLFAAEFDPNPDGAPEPDVYLDALWTTMERELRAIFRHCYRFTEVQGAGDFVRYIKRCQIETTMPFGDYWTGRPPFRGLPILPTAAAALIGGGAAGYGLWRLAEGGWRWPLAILFGLLVAIVVAAWLAKRHADRPFPAAPEADLQSVLKALYLQRAFVGFATAHQADDPATLHAAFGAFLDECQPSQPEPCQRPAVVGA